MVEAALGVYQRQQAFNHIQDSDQTARVYKLIKHDAEFKWTGQIEPYLIELNDSPRLQLGLRELIKLRLNSHRLAVETSRWYRNTQNNNNNESESESAPDPRSICRFCSSGAVEDEYHYLFKCSAYIDLRERLFVALHQWDQNIYELMDSDDCTAKFQYMLGSGLMQLNLESRSSIKRYLADCAIARQRMESASTAVAAVISAG
jgi:hypothetical protein